MSCRALARSLDHLFRFHCSACSLQRSALAQVQGKDASDSPNPVALPDAQLLAKELKLVLGEPPEWLKTKISAPGVHFAAIGGETSLFRLASELVDSKVITKVRLLEAIENMCGKSDLQFRLMEDVPAAMKQPQMVSVSPMCIRHAFLPASRPALDQWCGAAAMAIDSRPPETARLTDAYLLGRRRMYGKTNRRL